MTEYNAALQPLEKDLDEQKKNLSFIISYLENLSRIRFNLSNSNTHLVNSNSVLEEDDEEDEEESRKSNNFFFFEPSNVSSTSKAGSTNVSNVAEFSESVESSSPAAPSVEAASSAAPSVEATSSAAPSVEEASSAAPSVEAAPSAPSAPSTSSRSSLYSSRSSFQQVSPSFVGPSGGLSVDAKLQQREQNTVQTFDNEKEKKISTCI